LIIKVLRSRRYSQTEVLVLEIQVCLDNLPLITKSLRLMLTNLGLTTRKISSPGDFEISPQTLFEVV